MNWYKMFGRKNKEVKAVNPYDEKMRELCNRLAEIGWEMDKKIRKAYIASQAVVVYLEGSPDWKGAVADREEAQKALRASIGSYDSTRAEILRYLEENSSKMLESWSKPMSSHEWIAMELRIFLGKN